MTPHEMMDDFGNSLTTVVPRGWLRLAMAWILSDPALAEEYSESALRFYGIIQ